MAVLITTYGNNGNSRKLAFAKNTKEEMQDWCRDAYGNGPFVYREGIPSPIIYTVEEIDIE